MEEAVAAHGTDHAQVVRARGDLRKQLADRETTRPVACEFPRGGKCIAERTWPAKELIGVLLEDRQPPPCVAFDRGLGIEGVQLRWSARHKEKNGPLGARRVVQGTFASRPIRA